MHDARLRRLSARGGISLPLVVVVISVLSSTDYVHAQSTSSSETALKNFALATCLAHAFSGERAGEDAMAAAGAWLERGTASMERHEAAARLAKEFLERDYPSKADHCLLTMKCMDLFHSAELAELVSRPADRERADQKRVD